jgi:hypothetical protein
LVSRQPQVAHPSVVLPFLQMGKDALNLAAQEPLLLVALPIRGGELDVVRFLLQNAVKDTALPQPGSVGLGVVGFVGVDDLGVDRRNPCENFASYARAVLIATAGIT